MKRKLKVTRSSGNVFRDLGFDPEEAEHLLIRADLMIHIEKVLKARGLKQAEAAKIMRVTQLRVSDLLRARIDLFSTDADRHAGQTWRARAPRGSLHSILESRMTHKTASSRLRRCPNAHAAVSFNASFSGHATVATNQPPSL